MRRLPPILFALVLALGGAGPARAQASVAEAEVMATVRRLFDGMRAGDSAAVRSAFHPQATLASVGERDGATVLAGVPVDRFVAAVGTPHDEVWDERIANEQVRVDGGLATVWMDYTFYLGDRLSHCGVNAFELVRTAEGWKITRITDTRRREGCPERPRG